MTSTGKKVPLLIKQSYITEFRPGSFMFFVINGRYGKSRIFMWNTVWILTLVMLVIFKEAGVLMSQSLGIIIHRAKAERDVILFSLVAADWDSGRGAETVSVLQWGPTVSWHQCCCAKRPQHDCVITAGCCKDHAGFIKTAPNPRIGFHW